MPLLPILRIRRHRPAGLLGLLLAMLAILGGPPPVADAATDADADSLIILVADAWPPYNCADDDTLEGYLVEVARAVFEPLGYRVEYRIVPWPRALAGTLAGTYDAALGASPPEAEGLVFPHTELLLSRAALYARADSDLRIDGPADLDTLTVGAIRGYEYDDWLGRWLQANADRPDRVQLLSSDYPMRQNLQKLVGGRLDLVAGNPASIVYTAGRLGLADRIRQVAISGDPEACFIAFAPTDGQGARLAALLDDGVAALRQDGRFAAILARYGLRDWTVPEVPR